MIEIRIVKRYFFDIHDGDGFHRDEIGDEFDGLDDARQQAQALLPDIARDEQPGGDYYTIVCNVRDEMDGIVYRGELTYRGTQL